MRVCEAAFIYKDKITLKLVRDYSILIVVLMTYYFSADVLKKSLSRHHFPLLAQLPPKRKRQDNTFSHHFIIPVLNDH